MTLPLQPTLLDERWGPERWQVFNYYANQVRDAGGNPCLIWRTGGGGYSGSSWTGTSDYPGALFDKLNLPTNQLHFDLVSIQTSQQYIDEPGTNSRPRTTRHNMWDNIWDHKRGVAAIKAWGQGVYGQTTYQIDPYRIITGGHSFGGTISGLSMITPPITYDTSFKSGSAVRRFEGQQFDSSTRGLVWYSSQVDFRNRLLQGVVQDYLSPLAIEGIFGTRTNNNGNEWGTYIPTNFKNSVSMLYYIENNLTQYYKPMFIIYQNATSFNGGTNSYPLTNNHDSRMGIDLRRALDDKHLTYETDAVTINPGTEPTPMSSTNAANIYDWMERLIR